MPIKYSCFISYRSPSVKIAKKFQADLEEELGNFITLPVFRDEKEIDGGDFFDNVMALALCESVCMITLYTPTYFDEQSTYCSREYKAMEILEEKRLGILGLPKNKQKHGLIIPVLYRGNKKVPESIKGKRHCYDFVDWDSCGEANLDNPEYKQAIIRIAEYIRDRYDELLLVEKEIITECDMFSFPIASEIMDWIKTMLPPRPILPVREEIK